VTETIYVFLPNEGTAVWAPVDAEHIHTNVYRITNRRGEDEMQFAAGDLVKCRRQLLSGGESLVAYEKAAVNAL
jgi:hypothetical protein